MASAKTSPLVERRYFPSEDAQVRALRVLASPLSTVQRVAEKGNRSTLAGEETHEPRANRPLS